MNVSSYGPKSETSAELADPPAFSLGSLFSGIGGLELGLEAAGFGPIAWQVEQNPFCRRVLAKHWPAVLRGVEDVRDAGSATLPRVDVICGGFPCQDVSSAGKRVGLSGARSGLWYEYARILDELRPRGVVVENVASGARAWLPAVLAQLAELGYRARALGIAARDVGAPHRRSRVFVVGVADGSHRARRGEADRGSGRVANPGEFGLGARPVSLLERQSIAGSGDRAGPRNGVADADVERLRLESGRLGGAARGGAALALGDRSRPAEPGVDRAADGLPGRLDRRWPAGRGQPQHEWEPPRTVAPRTLPDRAARCKALGNAVVPHCAMIAGVVLRQMLEATHEFE